MLAIMPQGTKERKTLADSNVARRYLPGSSNTRICMNGGAGERRRASENSSPPVARVSST